MRKIQLFFLIVFFFLYLTGAQLSYAQTPSLIPIPSIPGMPTSLLTCGYPNTTDNKCCYIKPINTEDILKTKPNLPLVDQAIDIVNALYKQIVKPIADPLNTTAQNIIHPCQSGVPSTPGNPGDPSCICVIPTVAPLQAISKLCNNLSADDQGKCNSCVTNGGIYTAVDCISPNIGDFITKTLLGFGVGLAGTSALLCIIYASFTLQTSRGNPEKIKRAQELLTSCIMGLMLIIFSVFILRLIGVSILTIPGFL